MPLQLRRGTDSQRTHMSQPLAAGELIYVTDTKSIWIGDGTTVGGVPVANLSITDIQNIDANLFTNGTHTGITFTYVPNPSNPGLSKINATVNVELSNYAGTIKADAFKGTLVGDDSTILVDAVSGKINLSGTVKGDIVPNTTNAYTLGTSTYKFKDLYLAGPSLHLGAATISAVSSVIDLPAGSTVGGVAIGSGSGGTTNSLVNGSYSVTLDASNNLTFGANILSTIYAPTYDTQSSSDSYATILGNKTTTHAATLYVHAGQETSIIARGYTAGYAACVGQKFLTSRGTYSSPLAVQTGDSVGLISFQGWSGTDYQAPVVLLSGVDQVTGGQISGKLSAVIKNLSSQVVFDFTADGKFSSPVLATTVYSVAGTPLPSAATVGVGARAFVSDATSNTFGASYTGSSTNKVPVYSDGTTWRIG